MIYFCHILCCQSVSELGRSVGPLVGLAHIGWVVAIRRRGVITSYCWHRYIYKCFFSLDKFSIFKWRVCIVASSWFCFAAATAAGASKRAVTLSLHKILLATLLAHIYRVVTRFACNTPLQTSELSKVTFHCKLYAKRAKWQLLKNKKTTTKHAVKNKSNQNWNWTWQLHFSQSFWGLLLQITAHKTSKDVVNKCVFMLLLKEMCTLYLLKLEFI